MRQDVELETTIPSVLALRPSCLKLRVKDVKSSKCTVAYFYYLLLLSMKLANGCMQVSNFPRYILVPSFVFFRTHTRTHQFLQISYNDLIYSGWATTYIKTVLVQPCVHTRHTGSRFFNIE